MKEDNKYINEEDYTVDKFVEVYKKNQGNRFKDEYTATEVKEITGITRQPLRIIQERGIVNPRCEKNGNKKLYLFSPEDLLTICVAKIANGFGYNYDTRNEDEGKDPSILEIFSEYNNNLTEIAEYIYKNKGFSFEYEHVINMEFIKSFSSMDPKYAALMYQSMKSSTLKTFLDKINSESLDNTNISLEIDDVLSRKNIEDFVKALPLFEEIKDTDPAGTLKILLRLQELVEEAYSNERITSAMKKLRRLDTKLDDTDYESYKLIYDMGGFEKYKNLVEYIKYWELRRLSKTISKGILKEKASMYNDYIESRLTEDYENIIYLREDSKFARTLNEICGENAFKDFRTIRLYYVIEELQNLNKIQEMSKQLDHMMETEDNPRSLGRMAYDMFNGLSEHNRFMFGIWAEQLDKNMLAAGAKDMNLPLNVPDDYIDAVTQFFNRIGNILQRDFFEEDFVDAAEVFIEKSRTKSMDNKNDDDQILKNICEKRFKLLANEEKNQLKDQLDKELMYIKAQGVARRYIIVYEAMEAVNAKSEKYCFRGTITSSVISYVLDFSVFNPLTIEPKLYPEFFFGLDGSNKPSFEMNVSKKMQDKLKLYFDEYTGKESVKPRYDSDKKFIGVEITGTDSERFNMTFLAVDENEIKASLTDFKGYDITDEYTSEMRLPDKYNSLMEITPPLPAPKSLTDYVKCYDIIHSRAWFGNGDVFICYDNVLFKDLIADREDIYEFLLDHGVDQVQAFEISEYVRKGGAKWDNFLPEMEDAMEDAEIPEWFIESCKHITYLFPRAYTVSMYKVYCKDIID